jgi:hypothetical protein
MKTNHAQPIILSGAKNPTALSQRTSCWSVRCAENDQPTFFAPSAHFCGYSFLCFPLQ